MVGQASPPAKASAPRIQKAQVASCPDYQGAFVGNLLSDVRSRSSSSAGGWRMLDEIRKKHFYQESQPGEKHSPVVDLVIVRVGHVRH